MIKRTFIAALCLFAACSAFGFQTTAQVQDEQKPNGTPLPIIMYHAICPGRRERYVIPPDALEQDLRFLMREGYQTITVQDLVNFQQRNIPLPQKPVMLTFDDGNRTNYLHVFPLLKQYNLKAVMAVVGSFTDSNYDENGKPLANAHAYLTYEQIKEMHDSGLVEIQNHSYALHKISGRNGIKPKRGESEEEYEQFLSGDLLHLETQLETHAGFRCSAVAYPFGAFDQQQTVPVLQKLGYRAAFTCTEGINYITRRTNLFDLKRYNRPYQRSVEMILRKH